MWYSGWGGGEALGRHVAGHVRWHVEWPSEAGYTLRQTTKSPMSEAAKPQHCDTTASTHSRRACALEPCGTQCHIWFP